MKAIIKSTLKTACILCLALFTTLSANADVSFNSTRITADEVLATGEFYKTAFGMHEVDRLNLQGGAIELFLNFGASEEAARANSDAQLVIMQRAADEADDRIAHVIFDVSDIQATVAAVKAAGGTVEREPFEFGDTGIWIGMINDTAGNLVELLQRP
jgi:predicted enzyme related to lactoylglutathione lyase